MIFSYKVNKNYGITVGAHILLLFTGLNQFIPFKTELHGATSAQTFFPILLLAENFIQETGVKFCSALLK